MGEGYRIDQTETPWDMPHETFWDKNLGATVRRAQWVIDNKPEIPVEDVVAKLVLTPEESEQLLISKEN